MNKSPNERHELEESDIKGICSTFGAIEGLPNINPANIFIDEDDKRIVVAGRIDHCDQATAIIAAIKGNALASKSVLNCLILTEVSESLGFEWDTHLEYLLTELFQKSFDITKESRDGFVIRTTNWKADEIKKTTQLISALGILSKVRISTGED